ncbi:Hypothetical protein I595_2009 [Croceitalea dokdonensis DOKDO 023]|uniref:DUF922 domain-containing protein n=1 Tax=Croceitalea dokdonensis DOKDO 023 TaxID=1300341 RepID=A0A0P7AUL6_9FLAO|nr:DUF922 domain-containing protein [Croceitalea dokdonensis]KPM31522.1 Hypothetical protein I595_2009 [Croceitalea dokdonensis DOKDO 023]
MVRTLILSGFLILASAVVFSQGMEDYLLWHPEQRLSWSQFKGKVPVASVPAATTASGISYSYSANLLHHEVQLDFEVNAYFYPNASWYKPEVCDSLILSHEQLHFDITELYARKMRIELRKTTFTENVKSEVKKIYKRILKELSDVQDQYDWETNFSRNPKAQMQWNQRIKAALERTANVVN